MEVNFIYFLPILVVFINLKRNYLSIDFVVQLLNASRPAGQPFIPALHFGFSECLKWLILSLTWTDFGISLHSHINFESFFVWSSILNDFVQSVSLYLQRQ